MTEQEYTEYAGRMSPDDFDHAGRVRRAYRQTRRERIAAQGTVVIGVLLFVAVVWQIVWAVTA